MHHCVAQPEPTSGPNEIEGLHANATVAVRLEIRRWSAVPCITVVDDRTNRSVVDCLRAHRDWSGRIEPTNNFRVDFGFWTGTQLIAVEIDGKEPEGYERDVRRDRLLRRAEVDVVHILNTEIERHGIKVISELLPKPITFDWLMQPTPNVPFMPI